ncbi:hypothetical protein EVJ33_02805 [Exiguobacterium sp. SL-10]|uniref:hypothetical protein n=1 Tax=Exiguobacterium sp. SL-10 TaxID=2510962 RepID=UPI001038C847|nr:hypothetical protein [Exiguobacterium sp. SL-10]TCI32027.1 hypothetical protein EVJ33_02805 [Exiguobacterium sp. SL-10]
MRKHALIFSLSLCLFMLGLIGNLVFEAMDFFPNPTVHVISVPIASNAGYFIPGLLVLAIILLGLCLLPFALNRNKVKTTAIFLLAVILIPQLI